MQTTVWRTKLHQFGYVKIAFDVLEHMFRVLFTGYEWSRFADGVMEVTVTEHVHANKRRSAFVAVTGGCQHAGLTLDFTLLLRRCRRTPVDSWVVIGDITLDTYQKFFEVRVGGGKISIVSNPSDVGAIFELTDRLPTWVDSPFPTNTTIHDFTIAIPSPTT